MTDTTTTTDTRKRLLTIVLALCSAVAGATAADVASPPSELIWCCDAEGNCKNVATFSECPPGSWLYYCEWGWSTPESRDGASGWECLEQ